DWRQAADLASRFLDGNPAQSEPDCGVEPRRVFQAISRARGKAAAETAGQNHGESCRNDGLERWQTRWTRQQGVSGQHKMDQAGRRTSLYLVRRARCDAPQSRPTAAAD